MRNDEPQIMNKDEKAAEEAITRRVAVLKPQVEGVRGVMAYLDPTQAEKRTDVNKLFLASTIRGVHLHNRRQEEEKCWTLRHRERKLDTSKDRRRAGRQRRSRSRSRERRRTCGKKRPVWSSTSPSSRRREERKVFRCRQGQGERVHDEKREVEDERSYWARKKAEKASKLWEKLHSEGTVSVENAPDFSGEESDDDDVKPVKAKGSPSPERKKKKHKKKTRNTRNTRNTTEK